MELDIDKQATEDEISFCVTRMMTIYKRVIHEYIEKMKEESAVITPRKLIRMQKSAVFKLLKEVTK